MSSLRPAAHLASVSAGLSRLPLVGWPLRQYRDQKHTDEITTRLSVGNARAARMTRSREYDRVFSVAKGLEVPATTDSYDLFVDSRLYDQLDEFNRAVDAVRTALKDGNTIFVHCYQGMERAPTVTATVIAAERGISFTTALCMVKQRRPITTPTRPLKDAARAYLQEAAP